MADPIRVTVTGAAGNVAYSMLPRLASGEIFGDRKVILQLLEIPAVVSKLEGIKMELEDCSFDALAGVVISDDPAVAFKGTNWALLVGSRPRGPGMERGELLSVNGEIFVGQGKAIAANAAQDVRVVVVGNPCNTNALVGYLNASGVPADRWGALTRLDHNRARTALALKAGVPTEAVSRVTIWGNHSATQYPDFTNARINGKPVTEVITDRAWLETVFVPAVQTRGAAVIKARGSSSAFSAGSGALDHVKSLLTPTAQGDWVSMAVVSRGEYDVPAGLVFGYPCTTDGKGGWKVVEGLSLDAFGQDKFKITLDELVKEKEMVQKLLP